MDLQRFVFRKHLEPDEEIYFVAHKHWIEVLGPVGKTSLFCFIFPWVLWALFPPFFWIAVLWTLAGMVKFGYDIIDWYLDAWIATSQSVIDLEWKGVFHYTSSRCEYPAIEGLTYTIEGFWGTVLNFGNTQLDRIPSTAVILENAANPKKIEVEILAAKERHAETKSKADSDVLKDILSDMVAHHVRKTGWPNKKLKKVQL